MNKKRINPLITILLCAFAAAILTILVLYVFVGYRYINDTENGIKFIGMTENGLARDGKLYYSDGTRGTLSSETSTIMLDNGEQYTGELLGFLPNGNGILKKADGTVYDGSFKNGLCSGEAQVSYKSGDVYTGTLVDGDREGFGKYESADGTVYVGGFSKNLKNGKGKTSFSDGSVYIGEYKSSIKDGFGAYLFSNGDIFVGEFKADKRTGRGIYIWAKSEEYASEFDELFSSVSFDGGIDETFFAYYNTDFSRHFAEDSASTLISENPFWQTFEKILSRTQVECYVGEFSENLLSGKGSYRWLSGRVLVGEFVNGEIKTDDGEDETKE